MRLVEDTKGISYMCYMIFSSLNKYGFFPLPFIITSVKETKNIKERRKQPWLGGPLGYCISNLEDLYRDQLQR